MKKTKDQFFDSMPIGSFLKNLLNIQVSLLLVFLFSIAGCGKNESQNVSQNTAAQSGASAKLENKAPSASIDAVLTRRKKSGDFCYLYWEIKNNSPINFSTLYLESVAKDSAGNIVQKGSFSGTLPPNGTTIVEDLRMDCKSVAAIEITGFGWLTKIDGERVRDGLLNTVALRSFSKVKNFSVTSSGGPVPNMKNEVLTDYKKTDNYVLSMKYSTNPFEVREKYVGKPIETLMMVQNFEDEGVTAKMIDANSGFYCRMDGGEFGKHNKKGVIVVRGVLAEDSSRIGLEDCEFVSNDADWKADN